MLNLRSVLCIFLALLGLLSADEAAAKHKVKVKKRICGLPGKRCCPGGRCVGKYYVCSKRLWWKGVCISCGGKGDVPCRGFKCKKGLKATRVGRKVLCLPKRKCGGIGDICCRRFWCKRGLICHRRKRKCVPLKLRCGRLGRRCCRRGPWLCKRGLKCKRGWCIIKRRRGKGGRMMDGKRDVDDRKDDKKMDDDKKDDGKKDDGKKME